MAKENIKKNNFFKQMLKSIKDLDKYEDFALEMPKKAFGYFVKLVLVFAIILSVFYTYKVTDSVKNIYVYLNEKLPEFSYEDGTLDINSEEPIEINEYEKSIGKILIDTRISEEEISQYENKGISLLILKGKCITFPGNSAEQVEYKYSDLANSYEIPNFTKQELVEYIDNMNITTLYASIYFVIFIYIFIIYFISILIDVLLLSLLAYIISRISRIKLKYAPAFNISVHGITLPVILSLIYLIVNLLTGFNIKYFQLMYNVISYIYIIVAILMIKTDFINRQIELIKLEQEKEKIKEEIKQQEDKKEEKDKNKEPEDKENKKKKEKKEDKKGAEGEASPSSAFEEK